jgi:hypothetical protein
MSRVSTSLSERYLHCTDKSLYALLTQHTNIGPPETERARKVSDEPHNPRPLHSHMFARRLPSSAHKARYQTGTSACRVLARSTHQPTEACAYPESTRRSSSPNFPRAISAPFYTTPATLATDHACKHKHGEMIYH